MRLLLFFLVLSAGVITGCNNSADNNDTCNDSSRNAVNGDNVEATKSAGPVLDTADYNKRIEYMVNGDTSGFWPVDGPYPLPGAILPFKRVVAYYGNLYSKRMGALGEYPKEEMFKRLLAEVDNWNKADSLTPAIPALHYIAVTAQGAPGKDGKYRARMPFSQIDTIMNWSKEIDALVFLDIQVGHSNVKEETEQFVEYFKNPKVHFGIDPEFSMKGGERPGSVIGHFTAADINSVIDVLANVVKENNLPPKMLVIHRFTQNMIKNYKDIKLVSEVQVIIDMDGWGPKDLKAGTWRHFIHREPVQFTGFKIFYKNDLKKGGPLYTAEELMRYKPRPLYIQYQ